MPKDDPRSERERAVGLKCNDCGRRYEWNRNISRRRKCEECGCQWLEIWGAVVSEAEKAKWPESKRKWSEEHQFVIDAALKGDRNVEQSGTE